MSGLRVVVIGGGLVGLGTARALVRRRPDARVVVLEKEARLGAHQSTHNSGVLHAGLYYKPGSSKARLAVQGIRSMRAFCEQHNVRHEICGKLVVAVDATEVERLRALHERGTANGLVGLEWLSGAEAREREPHVAAQAALLVPEEGIVDYAGVVAALATELVAADARLQPGARVVGLRRTGGEWTVESTAGAFSADLLINCAGLQSDRVAAMAGARTTTRIVPFRGEYFELAEARRHLVRHLVYPVPDPAFPFLGVHFTRMIGGGIECGPNAVLALAREGYRRSDVSLRDAVESLAFAGVRRFVLRHARMSVRELWRSLSRSAFAASLQRLIPEVRADDLRPGGAGVRAQAMRPDGTLVEDFEFLQQPGAVHVINAPSPAATSSLAIGETVASMALDASGSSRRA